MTVWIKLFTVLMFFGVFLGLARYAATSADQKATGAAYYIGSGILFLAALFLRKWFGL